MECVAPSAQLAAARCWFASENRHGFDQGALNMPGLRLLASTLAKAQARCAFLLAVAWSCTPSSPRNPEHPSLIVGEVALRADYLKRFPCPSTVPAGLGTRTMPRGDDWQCSAVVATAAAFARAVQHSSYLTEWSRDSVRCVHVIPMRFTELNSSDAQGSLKGYWSVEFWNTRGQGARGVIEVPSGTLDVGPLYSEFGVPLEKHCPTN